MNKIVIDTNVCLDLFVFNEPETAWLLSLLQAKQTQAITCAPCREEWLRVLHYPQFSLDEKTIVRATQDYDTYLTAVADTPVNDVSLPVCRDKDDQKFMELAKQFQAKYLFTKDKALLRLNSRCKRMHHFEIIKPDFPLYNRLTSSL